MNSEERKKKFIALLKELLERDCDGVQARLAKKIKIGTTRISRWLSGKTDPLNLDALTFARIAELKNCSTEKLAKSLNFPEPDVNQPNLFILLLQEMLSNKTQEELGVSLGVSQIAISNWLNPDKNTNPANISAGTMLAIARQKGWSIDDLLIYLNLQKGKKERKLITHYQLELSALSLEEQVKILNWLFNLIAQKIKESQNLLRITENKLEQNFELILDRTLLIILEQENMAIVSNYLQKIYVHTNINPENITIATIQHLPEAIAASNILIFDISSSDSPSIALIQEIEFEGNMIVFAPDNLPSEIMANLSARVSDVLVKPVDWGSLKDKEYFR